MNPIYRGQYPPTNTDVIWLKDKTAYTFSNEGWAPIDNNSSYSRTQIDDMLKHYGKALSYNEDTGKLSIMNGEEELSSVTIKITLDNTLSETSENGIKNKAVYSQYMNNEDIQSIKNYLYLSSIPLTLRATASGNILWKSPTTQFHGRIDYKKNNDSWINITSTYGGAQIPVTAGDVIQLKNYYLPSHPSSMGCSIGTSENCKIHAYGNIMSLLYGDSFAGKIELINNYEFDGFFYGCEGLQDAGDLIMPATLLTTSCYLAMFSGCSNLVVAPTLPALSLVDRCYTSMFRDCSKLSNVVIHAENISAESCLGNWMLNVKDSGIFVCKKGVEFPQGASGIPEGWIRQDL